MVQMRGRVEDEIASAMKIVKKEEKGDRVASAGDGCDDTRAGAPEVVAIGERAKAIKDHGEGGGAGRRVEWCRSADSNRGPGAYETPALTS